MPICPDCGSERVWKDGLRSTNTGQLQRYLCRDCGYRFSETSWNGSKDPKCTQSVHRMALNMPSSLLSNRQICALETKRVKNLVKVETRTENRLAGATTQLFNAKSKILEYAWWEKKNGKADSTIEGRTKLLKILVKRGADLYDPETIKEVIAKQQWCNGRKKTHATPTHPS